MRGKRLARKVLETLNAVYRPHVLRVILQDVQARYRQAFATDVQEGLNTKACACTKPAREGWVMDKSEDMYGGRNAACGGLQVPGVHSMHDNWCRPSHSLAECPLGPPLEALGSALLLRCWQCPILPVPSSLLTPSVRKVWPTKHSMHALDGWCTSISTVYKQLMVLMG